MLRSAIILMLVLSTVVLGQAQNNTFSSAEDSDPAATKILDALKRNYLDAPSIQLEFSLQIELQGDAMEEFEGQIIQKDEQFFLDMDQQVIYCNGKSIWVYIEELNEVQINDADFDDSSEILSPSQIIGLYESGQYAYGISFQGLEKEKRITQIEFKPLDKDSDYSKMRLTLEDNDRSIQSLKVFSKDGSRYTMLVNKIDLSQTIEDAVFNFDATKFPEVIVEDLRLD